MVVFIDETILPMIKENQLIKADAGHRLKEQRFRIKRIVPRYSGKVEIYAEHVSYLTSELLLKKVISKLIILDISEWQEPLIIKYDKLAKSLDGVIVRI